MSQSRILIVEDKENEREALVRMLRQEEYAVCAAANPEEALGHLEEQVDLIVSDLRMGANSGIDLLRFWKSRRPETPVILMTAYGEVGSAVEAMKLGANDYLMKPVNPEELLVRIGQCIENHPPEEIPPQERPSDGSEERPGNGNGGTSLRELQRAAIERALQESQGHRTHAAEALGISVRTLQRKLKAWGSQTSDVPS